MKDFTKFIPSESDEIKNHINTIFNHPLIEEKWIVPSKREFECYDGGTIDFREENIELSVQGVVYLTKKLLKYKPKRIMEVGMNAGSFSIICKLVLGDVKIYTIDRMVEFEERVKQINDFFGENLITFYQGDSNSQEFRNWITQFRPYDLAWIDGNHSTEFVTYDIHTAIISDIPMIWCDDYGKDLFTDVYDVVHNMVDGGLLSFIENSNLIGDVGSIAILQNNRAK